MNLHANRIDSHDAAMVSTLSDKLGGQYALLLATTEAATLITTTSGPGVSGILVKVYSGTFEPASETVMVPVPACGHTAGLLERQRDR